MSRASIDAPQATTTVAVTRRLAITATLAAAIAMLGLAAVASAQDSSPSTSSPGAVPRASGPAAPVPTASRWSRIAPSIPPDPPASPRTPVATRIVIRSLGIDLPVISRLQRVPGQGPNRYPPCDVALYWDALSQPGRKGTTYIYAHAQEGMFLPLLIASLEGDGRSLIGDEVLVYTSDDLVHVYQLTRVKRHATDWSLVERLGEDSEHLVLQTSEGQGDDPKLQVAAKPVRVELAGPGEASPEAKPRPCFG